MRKELLGVVGVDSGHLVITDPVYIKSSWLHESDKSPVVRFWGRRARRVASNLQNMGYEVIKRANVYEVGIDNIPLGYDYDTFVRLIKDFAGDDKIAVQVIHDSLIDKVFDIADNENKGGQVNYPLGHPGLGVVFQSGLGDGVYEVWAYYDDIEGWGERIVKVEVVLIPEEDN